MHPTLEQCRNLVLKQAPTSLGKLVPPKDMLDSFQVLTNRAESIQKTALSQPGLGKDPLINDQPGKNLQLVAKLHLSDIVKMMNPTVLWVLRYPMSIKIWGKRMPLMKCRM